MSCHQKMVEEVPYMCIHEPLVTLRIKSLCIEVGGTVCTMILSSAPTSTSDHCPIVIAVIVRRLQLGMGAGWSSYTFSARGLRYFPATCMVINQHL